MTNVVKTHVAHGLQVKRSSVILKRGGSLDVAELTDPGAPGAFDILLGWTGQPTISETTILAKSPYEVLVQYVFDANSGNFPLGTQIRQRHRYNAPTGWRVGAANASVVLADGRQMPVYTRVNSSQAGLVEIGSRQGTIDASNTIDQYFSVYLQVVLYPQ